jgi:hypothetical protein
LRAPAAFASPAVGVGQVDTAWAVSEGFPFNAWVGLPFVPSLARGVCHPRAIVSSDGLPFVAYSSRPSPGHPLFELP